MNCVEEIHLLAFKHLHDHTSNGTSADFISKFLSSICTLLFEKLFPYFMSLNSCYKFGGSKFDGMDYYSFNGLVRA